TGCKTDDDLPEPENEVEVITDVVLTFTNASNGSDIVRARAKDPDGAGIQELVILDSIKLDTSKTYILTLDLLNALDSVNVESITEEVEEEGDEHQFYFSYSNNAFANPTGDGNFDNFSDPLNYNDLDVNGNSIGLSTNWTTSNILLENGVFRVRLQHQPDIKTATTGVNDGDTDIDLSFVLVVQ
ncbi:MAG: hypothetical protein ACI8ZO_000921, partial [Flavobacteriales bacterium]